MVEQRSSDDVDAEALHAGVLDEHAAFVELIGSLTGDEWQAPSLCRAWSVRDVVIHVADHVHRSGVDAMTAFIRGGFSPTRSAQATVTRHRGRSNEEIVAWMATPVRSPSAVQLAELLIHHQDIRRAIDRRREVPQVALVRCLDFCLSRKGDVAVAGARSRASGLRLVATDAPWEWGRGGEVSGPAEALLLALSGRTAAIADLAGDGLRGLGTSGD